MIASMIIAVFTLSSPPVTAGMDLPAHPLFFLGGELDGGAVPCLENGFIGTRAGYPDLPSVSNTIDLPPGMTAVSARAVNCRWETVDLAGNIRPLPEPCVLSGTPSRTVEPAAVFSMNAFWPPEPVELAGTGYPGGTPSAEVIIHPLRYNPVTGELQRLISGTVSIGTAPGQRSLSPPPLPAEPDVSMLVITSSEIREPFDSLAAWRTAEGIPTEVVTTDQVYTTPGVDDAERIRNYIIERYQNDGIEMVLLGGDTNYIPCRFAYPMSYEWSGGREDNMPCDLYYSDLDGTWNLDGDDIWGEVEDSVDLWQDVLVSRAPCEDLEEAWTFWNKIRDYETTDPGHFENALLAAAVLWQNPFTDEAVLKRYIRDNYLPGWFTSTELYQTEGNYNTSSVVQALGMGTGYVNLNDHGWINIVGCLDNDDVSAIDSDNRYFGMMYSVGCWTSAFDSDCISERFLNNPNGCGVSYIGNSSYGWGSPGNPLFGYSDRFDRELFKLLFQEPELRLGELLAGAKDSYIPFAHQENCYRCVLYMVNLLGDPSMRTFRRTPVIPEIQCPEIVSEYTSFIPVTVAVPGEWQPGDITVCLSDPELDTYHVAVLDGSGHHVFQLDTPPDDDLKLTVTGTDLRRTSITVPMASGSVPLLAGVTMESSPAPGSECAIAVTIQNGGTDALTGLNLTAVLLEGPGSLTQPFTAYGDLSPGASSTGNQPLELLVDSGASTGEILALQLELTADQGEWTIPLPLLVYAPGLYFASFSVDDSAGGNGNGYAEQGESFFLELSIANSGLLAATDVTASVSSQESWLTWTVPSASVPQIDPEATAQLTFQGNVSTSAPGTAFPAITLSTEAIPQWSGEEEITFIIGQFNQSSDFEGGPEYWTHQGEPDQWHLSQGEPHSGQWAWWCGDENTGTYQDDMDCSLLSPALLLAPEAELSFWSCFDVDLYGSDGLYVILRDLDGGTSDTLDFIGAGGLLGIESFGVDGNMMWLPRSYDLSAHAPGTTVQVEFCFHSDNEEAGAGAFHIDDVTIDGYRLENGTGGPEQPFLMGLPRPNPTRGAFSIDLASSLGGWKVTVFDIAGRVVAETTGEDPWFGELTISLGRPSAGVYLIRAENPEQTAAAKVIVTTDR